MKTGLGEACSHWASNTNELTKRIQAGSRTAEEEFVRTYFHSIKLLLLSKTRNPDIANDCCQQTLLITLIKIRAGDIVKPESLSSFLRRTADNVATIHFRKERRYISLNNEAFHAPAANGNEAEEDIDSEKIRIVLNDILDLLKVKRDREILRRFYLRDEDKSAIRRDLNISAAHFDRVLYRARSRLRRLLDYHEDIKTLFRQSIGNRTHLSRKRHNSRHQRKKNANNIDAYQT